MNRVFATALLATAGISISTMATAGGPVTFSKDVLPILQESCQDCHRPNGANLGGMVAPMAFITYEETRPWAKSIAKRVASREMPPWDATPEFNGLFHNERTLTQEEIDTIVTWVKQGAKQGDPADAPAPREFPDTGGWQIGTPDLIVKMPERFFVEDDVEDLYVDFEAVLTDDQHPEDRYIKSIEFRPGSPVVHHIISNPLGGIAPGNDPTVYPDGYGQMLRRGSSVSFEMHYHKEPGPGTGVWDQSMAAIKFYPKDEKPEHLIQMALLENMHFKIPPGDPNYMEESEETFDDDILVLSYTPHMHLRGKSAKYTALYPDGRIENLLEVPEYDFNWQTSYRYKEPKLLPAGTKVHLAMAWDNSAGNPSNPDPTKTVTFGEPTTAEMFFGFMNYAYANEQVEVVVDEAILDSYAGTYQVGQGFKFKIESMGTYLAGELEGNRVAFTTKAENQFYFGLAKLTLTFLKNDAGEVDRVQVETNGMNMVATRVQENQTSTD